MTNVSTLFDRWAPSYDTQLNPLLHLEERIAPALLPALEGKDILDIGCGTGRWLQRFEAVDPASLTGVDASEQMLQRAAVKLSKTTMLHCSEGTALPISNASTDLILCSFTVSYIDDLPAFARECSRVLKPGGTMLLTDMHPVTAAERQWTRNFHDGAARVDLPTQCRSLDQIATAFATNDMTMCSLDQPAFDLPERDIFKRSGKLETFNSLTETSAIYLMTLRKRRPVRLANAPWSTNSKTWCRDGLALEDGKIVTSTDTNTQDELDLSGYVLLPGLINAHDHLEFALFPNLGRSPNEQPYRNASEWAHEIHIQHTETIAQHRRVPLATRLSWGAIRNLLSGVTTVCHHNPFHEELADPAYPLQVISAFGWGHSLAFDTNLEARFAETPAEHPFLLHAAEGTDEQSRDELHALDQRGLLTKRTILIHGLALRTQEIDRLNRFGASLIVCPTSNRLLFHHTMPQPLLESVHRIAIGSDSPLTAAGDLLDEIRYLHTEVGLSAESLYAMVTTNAADILRLQNGQGTLEAGGSADLIAVRDKGLSPAATLAGLTLHDIELVLIAGRVQVASSTLYERLTPQQRAGLHPLDIDGARRYVRAPVPALFDAAEEHLGYGQLRLGNKEVRRVDAL